jgi:hypothetical protein
MKNLRFLTHQELFDRAVDHLFRQGQAALLPRGGGAYRGSRGGCPVGGLITPLHYTSAMEGVPVRYIDKPANEVPAYMDAGIAALKKALLKARVNIYDPTTVSLLSCLQNVHDAFGVWEWRERLTSIARQFGLSMQRLEMQATRGGAASFETHRHFHTARCRNLASHEAKRRRAEEADEQSLVEGRHGESFSKR